MASLLLRIMALVAVLVGAVVAAAQTRAWWTVALAVAGLVLAAAAVGVSLRGLLARDADAEPEASGRSRVAALTAVAAVAVVLAVALPVEDSAATSTARPSAAAAAQTVRDFLASAVLDDNAYSACQYLTPAAQQRVARLAGDGQTCRDALTAAQPAFAGIRSEGALHALGLRAVVRGATAYVTALSRDRRRATFVLRRTTPMQAAGYEAPPAAWRIAGGATAVLRRRARFGPVHGVRSDWRAPHETAHIRSRQPRPEAPSAAADRHMSARSGRLVAPGLPQARQGASVTS